MRSWKPTLLLVAACGHGFTDGDAVAIGGLVQGLTTCGLAVTRPCPAGGTFAIDNATIAVADCIDATGLAITTEMPLAVTTGCIQEALAAHVTGELDWEGGGSRDRCMLDLELTRMVVACPTGGDGCEDVTFTGTICGRAVDVDCAGDDPRCTRFDLQPSDAARAEPASAQ